MVVHDLAFVEWGVRRDKWQLLLQRECAGASIIVLQALLRMLSELFTVFSGVPVSWPT